MLERIEVGHLAIGVDVDRVVGTRERWDDVARLSTSTCPTIDRSPAQRSYVRVEHPLPGPGITSYLGDVGGEPVIARSALKHGMKAEDIVHAYWNPIRVWDLGDGFTMTVGPSRAATILEVGYVKADTAMVIVHAMPVREKFLR